MKLRQTQKRVKQGMGQQRSTFTYELAHYLEAVVASGGVREWNIDLGVYAPRAACAIALHAGDREASPRATETADRACMRRYSSGMHMPDSGDRVGCPLARPASRREVPLVGARRDRHGSLAKASYGLRATTERT